MAHPWFLLSLALAAGAPNGETAWRFEDAETGWHARAATVAAGRAPGIGATPESKACLHVGGRIDTGWNYAASDQRPMTAGQCYRFSAWVRVDRLGPKTPMPYLKCEFVAAEAGRDLGRVSTETYRASAMGKWQRLEAEFRAPEGTVRCWVALEKGTGDAAEIDAYLDDVRLEPIPGLSAVERYRLRPLPKPMQARRGVHPRLFLDAARVAKLRGLTGDGGPGTGEGAAAYPAMWKEVRALADRAAASGPPAYGRKDSSGDEQLWQREVGNAMPSLAMAYLLTDERKYLDAARAWALASCGYATWGLGAVDGMDLATGHQLLGLALVYDWCYNDLGEEARRTIRETLVRRAGKMFQAAVEGRAWWRHAYLQNHLWVNTTGMAAAGFALYDEVEDAILWVGYPLDVLKRTTAFLGPDGASHEGVGYWQYGAEYLLKSMHLMRELAGADLYDSPWWRNTAFYSLYLSLPRAAWTRQSCIVDVADCPRNNWYGPEYLLRALAHEYRDGHAQWLAEQVDAAVVDSPGARWLNLVWYDPAIAAEPPAGLPTLRHFEDMGLVSARTSWSGSEALLVFKCGPFIGHKAMQEFDYDPGGGHVHPDANHFVLFGEGEWLIRDDGYLPKSAENHNTLLVDGKGQLGEGAMWYRGGEALAVKARPRILRAVSTPELDHVAGDAAEAYPRESGLRRYVRHVLFLKPDVLIIADDVSTGEARPLELRFHPEYPVTREADGTIVARGRRSLLRFQALTPEGVSVEAGETEARGEGQRHAATLPTIRVRAQRQAWRNAVAFSWSGATGTPAAVALKAAGDRWTFTAGTRAVTLDWAKGAAGPAR